MAEISHTILFSENLDSVSQYKLGIPQITKSIEFSASENLKKECTILETLVGSFIAPPETEIFTTNGFKKLIDISEGEFVACQRYKIHEHIFTDVEQLKQTFHPQEGNKEEECKLIQSEITAKQIPAYYGALLAGVYWQCGKFHSDKRRTTIELSVDAEIAGILVYILQVFKIACEKCSSGLLIHDKNFCRTLQSWKRQKEREKKVALLPDWITSESMYILAFLQGLFSACGRVDNDKIILDLKLIVTEEEIKNKYAHFFIQLKKLFEKYGITFYIKTFKKTKTEFEVLGFIHPKYKEQALTLVGFPLRPSFAQSIQKELIGEYSNKYTNASTSIIKWIEVQKISQRQIKTIKIITEHENAFLGGFLVKTGRRVSS